jgi:DNA-binding transcriptional LysR family regulator
MDFRRLEVFLKVYELRSFSQAGQALYLAQPTISEHIRLLEEELGLSLFDRQGKAVQPTKTAQLLYHYARQIMALREESLQALIQFRDKGLGDLLVGGSNIPGQYLLPSLLGQFKGKFPQIRIQLFIGDSRNIIERVLEGSVELGVIGARIEHKQMHCQFLTNDELVCIVPPGNSLSQEKSIDLQELTRLPFILREVGSGTRTSIEQAFGKIKMEVGNLKVAAEMGSNEAIRQAVKAGLGISIISRLAVEDDLRDGRLQEVRIKRLPLMRSFYLISQKQRTLSPLAQEFKETILRAFKKT